MAVWRYISFNVPEAQRLADLIGVDHDLQSTGEICDLLLEVLSQIFDRHYSGQNPNVMVDALSSAALVRYARVFADGVRARYPTELLESLDRAQLEDHRTFLDLRDKFVAHSVNAFEMNDVVAYLVPEDRGPRNVESISVQQHRLLSLGRDDARKLKDLTLELRRRLSATIEEERARVLAVAKAQPMDTLYSQRDAPLEVVGPGDEGKRRRMFRPRRR